MGIQRTWGSIRSILRDNFTFYEMKELVGAAGLPTQEISHLRQKQGGGGATKGQLIDGIEGLVNDLSDNELSRFLSALIEDMTDEKPSLRSELETLLERVGWGLSGNTPYPLSLQLDIDMDELPEDLKEGIDRALKRYRDGDKSGAVTAICGVVDSMIEDVYQKMSLGDPHKSSYQEGVSKSFNELESKYKSRFEESGIEDDEIDKLWQNHRSAVNQSAFVLGSLRRNYSDAHGVKDAPKEFVQWAIDCAVFIVRSFLPLIKPMYS